MPDQPQPDFSQTQQYAPGFQAQPPIPGISSSFPQFPQQSFNSGYSQSPFLTQQADMIAVQGMTNARTTMAIAQQNLMNSMHTALLGTMNAFSDVSRRGGSMITAMAPVGAYNDMLAPNQNWALESSFKREMGYRVSNMLGLDPYNSVASRFIQGRRPEFLTEGEYGSTMRIAEQLRSNQMMTGLKSVGVSAGMGWAMSAMGIGLAPALAIPMAVTYAADAYFESQNMEEDERLRNQMYVKNRRMGIGQQYINTKQMDRVSGAFFAQDNPHPFMQKLLPFGLGDNLKPDVEKMKIFTQASESGLMAFEHLDSDSIINYVNKIAATVEKFSRLGKVTREVGIKIMSEIKASGIHGDALMEVFGDTARQSNLTGIDMQTLNGIRTGATQQAQQMGFNNVSANMSMGNIISGFAMMQNAGAFRNKDIMQMSQSVFQNNMADARNSYGMFVRYGGLNDAYKGLRNDVGGGDPTQGYLRYQAADLPVGDLDMIKRELAAATKEMGSDEKAYDFVRSRHVGDPNMMQVVEAVRYGLDKVGKKNQEIAAYAHTKGREAVGEMLSVNDIGANAENREEPGKAVWTGILLNPNFRNVGDQHYDFGTMLNHLKDDGTSMSKRRAELYGEYKGKVKRVLDKYKTIDNTNVENVTFDIMNDKTVSPIDRKTGKFVMSHFAGLLGQGDNAAQLAWTAIRDVAPEKWQAIEDVQNNKYMTERSLSGKLAWMRYNMLKGSPNVSPNVNETAGGFVDYLTSQGKRTDFAKALLGIKADSVHDLATQARSAIKDLGLDSDRWINDFEGNDQNVISLVTGLMDVQHSYSEKQRGAEQKILNDLGYKIKEGKNKGQNDYVRLERALSPIQKFRNKYYNTATGEMLDSAKDKTSGLMSNEFTADAYALLNSSSKDTKQALREWLPPEFETNLFLKDFRDRGKGHGQASVALASTLGEGLSGRFLDNFSADTLKKLKEDSGKDASADPSDTAIVNLNKLLEKIVKAMDKTPEKGG